ncbi:MAG: LysR family transcriptional regulator [Clostridia bacterium]
MDFRELTYIIAIAQNQNITKAANSLYLSQPTLSKFLQTTEKNLGQKLFNRIGNKLIPTYAGERYLATAHEILSLKSKLDCDLSDIIKSDVGSLDVAFTSVRGAYMLPFVLPIFKERYPNVLLHLEETSMTEIENLILSDNVEIGFFNKTAKIRPELACQTVKLEELVLVMSPKNPLSKKSVKTPYGRDWFDLSLLKNELLILQNPQQSVRQVTDFLLEENNVSPNEPLVTSNIFASIQLASKNYGVTFAYETHVKHLALQSEIVCFSIGKPNTIVEFVAAYRKGYDLSYHAQEYINIVKDFT